MSELPEYLRTYRCPKCGVMVWDVKPNVTSIGVTHVHR